MVKNIPIFYACDDNFVKYTIVSLYSMIKNSSRDYDYTIYILNTNISEDMKKEVLKLENDNYKISFIDVSDYLQSIAHKLPLRDYYSKTTYFRFFIADMFPNLKKAIYIDSDTIVQYDISKLYEIDLQDNYLGACHDQAMVQVDTFGTYAEKVVGVSRFNFFNAGMLLINCDQFRKNNILDKFIYYLNYYNFVVTQDEDYLNLICKDHVYWLDQKWNTLVFGKIDYPINEAYIIHYIMVNKPWHYHDCRYSDIFWKYAKKTSVYQEILNVLNNYTDEERKRDQISADNLHQLALSEINKEDNFINLLNKEKRSKNRVEIINKINAFEKEGKFDEDLEEDPPTKVLLPDDIEYIKKGLIKKIKRMMAYKSARKFVYKKIKENEIIIKDIKGIENLNNLNSGAIITCNHFNAYDSFAMQIAYEASTQTNRTFYRVIREGNYTNFPGFYGFLMRNCNTLPLSSNYETMKKFIKSTEQLLKDGNLVLIYPEQAMWWNYRKPRPLKTGGFNLAVKSNVPVLPCFITMQDSFFVDNDGFPIQEYTIHILPPIYPLKDLSINDNVNYMMDENSRLWKEVYEKTYHQTLDYSK